MRSNTNCMFVALLLGCSIGGALGDVNTGSAVPYKYFPEVSTKTCSLIEPVYNHTFDLGALHSDLGHKVNARPKSQLTNFDEFVEFNVCGAHSKKCNGRTQVAACYTRNKQETVIGVSPVLYLRDGALSFEMEGDTCNNTSKYTTSIKLVCAYDAVRYPVKLTESGSCNIEILWFTKLACLPLPKYLENSDCSVTDPKSGHTFDLSPLASQKLPSVWTNDTETILLSVCKPVPFQKGGLCPSDSSVCVVKDNGTTLQQKFINVGSTIASPSYEQDTLFMHFESTEKCIPSKNYSAYITFSCEPSTPIGRPEYLGVHNCQYNFNWQTSLACISAKPCLTVDPSTGFTYDVSALSTKSYTVKNGDKSYTFGVCKAAGSPCAEAVGACQTSGGNGTQTSVASLGAVNHYLRFNQTGSPFLLYNSGAVCGDLKNNWSTEISFICATDGMAEGPVVVENDKCQFVVHFVTKLVCQEQIMCKAYDWKINQDVDLTPLMSSTKNYLASVSSERMRTDGPPKLFFLNVCKPLVPQYGLSCKGGSAACLAQSSITTPINEMSLGFADASLVVVDTPDGRRPQLRYLRGATCPHDPKTELSTLIEFYCNTTAGQGNPVLKNVIDDCHFHFDWPTNVICPEHSIEIRSKTCALFSNDTNIEFDLKSVTDKGDIKVEHKPDPFTVNVCDNPNSQALINYAESTVKLFFRTKGPCKPDGNIDIELRLVCKDTEHHSAISDTEACTLVLTIDTPLVCPILGIDINRQPDSIPSLHMADPNVSPIGSFLITILALGSVCGIVGFLLYRHPDRRVQISNWILRRDPGAIQYSRVHTEPEASILLPQNGRLTDSDDELIV